MTINDKTITGWSPGNTFTNPTYAYKSASSSQTPAQKAGDAISKATTHLGGAVSAAQSGLDAVKSGQGLVDSTVAKIGGLADSVSGYGREVASFAPSVAALANPVMQDADAVRNRAGTYDDLYRQILGMNPEIEADANRLHDNGMAMWDQSQSQIDRANQLYGNAEDWRTQNRNSSDANLRSLLGILDSYDPEQYAKEAGINAQTVADSTYQQMLREVSRRGGTVSSGNALALQAQQKRMLATAKSSAMNAARKMAVDQQKGIIETIMKAYNENLTQGNSAYNIGVSQESAANSAIGTSGQLHQNVSSNIAAAGNVYDMGTKTLGSAAQLDSAAAGILGSAANLFGVAGQLEAQSAGLYGNAVSINNQFLNTLRAAYGDVGNAEKSAASFYSGLFNTLEKGSKGGGVRIINNDQYNQSRKDRGLPY